MRERPILFSSPMVRAILEDRKTKTRRVVKPQPPAECGIHYMLGNESWLPPEDRTPLRHTWEAWGGPLYHSRPAGYMCGVHDALCPYGAPGDVLWVREAFQVATSDNGPCVLYRANAGRWYPEYTGKDFGAGPSFDYDAHPISGRGAWSLWAADVEAKDTPWRPGIHMPRWASRITLRITDVRVERLNEISEADAIAEGIATLHDGFGIADMGHDSSPIVQPTASQAFRFLWDRINGEPEAGKPDVSWAANPWVWVVAFERVTP